MRKLLMLGEVAWHGRGQSPSGVRKEYVGEAQS